MREKQAEIHRGSRRQYIGPLKEAGYTSAIVILNQTNQNRCNKVGSIYITQAIRCATHRCLLCRLVCMAMSIHADHPCRFSGFRGDGLGVIKQSNVLSYPWSRSSATICSIWSEGTNPRSIWSWITNVGVPVICSWVARARFCVMISVTSSVSIAATIAS